VASLKLFNREKTNRLFRAKMQYGQLLLFRYPQGTFVFRPLTIIELETIMKLSDSMHEIAIEDWIVETTFVGTEEEKNYLLNKTPFLLVKYLAGKIALASNIQEEADYKKRLIDTRSKVNTLQNVVETIVGKAYKSYKHDDIKDMTQTKLFEVLVKSEIIAQEQLDISNKKQTKAALRQFTEGATVIGGEDITNPAMADKPEF
jgi:hypothetical protein